MLSSCNIGKTNQTLSSYIAGSQGEINRFTVGLLGLPCASMKLFQVSTCWIDVSLPWKLKENPFLILNHRRISKIKYSKLSIQLHYETIHNFFFSPYKKHKYNMLTNQKCRIILLRGRGQCGGTTSHFVRLCQNRSNYNHVSGMWKVSFLGGFVVVCGFMVRKLHPWSRSDFCLTH